MTAFKLGEDEFTFEAVELFLRGRLKVVLTPSRRRMLAKVRRFVEGRIDAEHAYYGINTGFGRLANEKIDIGELEELQANLIRSHAFGVGDELSRDAVKLMMLFRAHSIAMGYSGASLSVIDLLVRMIQRGVWPVVPSKGSVGASGDLVPLAHLALAMIGEGEAYYNDKKLGADSALKAAGLKPVKLSVKDGISLINGTQAMTAVSAIAILKARRLIKLMDMSAALSVEGMRGSISPFDSDIHKVRNQNGQKIAASMIRRMIKGSGIIKAHAHCSRVQDPYSLRCVPQVHGAVRDAYRYASEVVLKEMNACTDNPLVFEKKGKIISGGNFHGEPIAIAVDALSIAMAELGSISERRIEQLTNPKSGDLPVLFLTPRPGLNSGFMIPHVVAASLASENKTLAHPASIDSMPTSAGQEDHVSMGMWAARKAIEIIKNVEWIAVIEMMAAAQAIDLHEEKFRPGAGTAVLYGEIRRRVKFLNRDRYMIPEAKRLHRALVEGDIVDIVEKKVGRWIV